MNRGSVIVVEDDEVVRGVLVLLLESEGWTVTEARDGEVGLRLARRLSADVVVTDLRMPGMSGLEMARRIAEMSDPSGVPIVAITSDVAELRAAAIDSGRFTRVLSKPLRPVDFLDAVRDAVHATSA